MNYLPALTAAIKGKAPIAAIPVEGHAPVCVNRKRLAAWSKGVTITRVAVDCPPPMVDFIAPRSKLTPAMVVEGPLEKVVTPSPHRRLIIEGTAGRVRTRCTMFAVDRRTAVKELSAWSEKERAKLEKQRLLGALSTTQRKAMRRAKHETKGEGMIMVEIKMSAGGKKPVYGLPVTVPALADLTFVVHRSVSRDGELREDDWTVSERFTGLAAGSAATAELALVEAARNSAKAKPERLAAIRAQVAEAAALHA